MWRRRCAVFENQLREILCVLRASAVKTRVVYSAGAGSSSRCFGFGMSLLFSMVIMPKKASSRHGEGWRYDDPVMPTLIELCPDTCNALKGDNGASIRVVLGCATVLK